MDNLTMSTEQGFRAMSKILDEYRKRVHDGGDLAAVLSDIQMMADGRPADAAAWEDWLKAVRIVLENTPH
ncbi:MAG: hypothetical protein WB611_09160 [Stellaceae bacterium]